MTLYTLFSLCLNISYTQVGRSANYAVLRESNTLYIFFQGSDGKNDWKNNLDFPAKPYKRMGKQYGSPTAVFCGLGKKLSLSLRKKSPIRAYKKLSWRDIRTAARWLCFATNTFGITAPICARKRKATALARRASFGACRPQN